MPNDRALTDVIYFNPEAKSAGNMTSDYIYITFSNAAN